MTLRSWIQKLIQPRSRSRRGRIPRHEQCPKRWGKPWLEALEDRLAPATITVMTTNDGPDPGPAGSLRHAIDTSASGDTIIFTPALAGQTITLTRGQLTIAHSLNIVGLGADQIAVSGNLASRVFEIETGVTATITGLTIENGFASTRGGGIQNFGTLTLTDCTVSGNIATGRFAGVGGPYGGYGGGIFSAAFTSLTVIRSTLSGNAAIGGAGQAGQHAGGGGGGGGGEGGAIFSIFGFGDTTLIQDSTISGNFAIGGAGGASAYPMGLPTGNGGDGGNGSGSGSLSGKGGTGGHPNGYAGNYAGGGGGGYATDLAGRFGNGGAGGAFGGGGGGGAYTSGLVGGKGGAGGLYAGNGGNSINQGGGAGGGGAGVGGGIYLDGAGIIITSSTIANNTATGGAGGADGGTGVRDGSPGAGVGGGVFNSGGRCRIDSTIIAKNIVNGPGGTRGPDVVGTFSDSGYNLIGNTFPSSGFTAVTTITNVDPLLNPLANNGGPTQTMSLRANSQAIDNGDPVNSPSIDQRGAVRGSTSAPGNNANAGLMPDIGAWEASSLNIVTTIAVGDPANGDSSNIGTLREAVEWADASINPTVINTTPNVVRFDTGGLFATPQTITLTLGQLTLSNTAIPESIVGDGVSNLTVTGNNASRVVRIVEAISSTISGMTLTGGKAHYVGGGIFNYFGNLILNNVVITGNQTVLGDGGALYNEGGTVNITNSTISKNSSPAYGGGIENGLFGASLTITNSTISANNAPSGAAVAISSGVCFINNSTIAANVGGGSAHYPGSVDSFFPGTSLTITNSTIADNPAGGLNLFNLAAVTHDSIFAGNTGFDVKGNIGSQGHNLIQNPAGGSGFIASDLLNVNPLLGPLVNNGGPTQTLALGAASPAIDAGDNNGALAFDQRGSQPPPGFARIINGIIDIGAFEDQLVQTAPTAPSSGIEGALQTYALGSFTDAAPVSSWTLTIIWGDGSPNTVVNNLTSQGAIPAQPHTYAEEGTYTAKVNVSDADGDVGQSTFTVTVTDPNLLVGGGFSFTAVEGQLSAVQRVAAFSDPTGAEANDGTHYSASINWGDGTPATTGTIDNSFNVNASHTYAEEGSYTVTITVFHEGATPQMVNDPATVSDPNVVAVGGFAFSAVEESASASQKVATFTDPAGPEANDGTHYSATINWGDGSGTSLGTISVSGATLTVSGSHSYAEEGSYTISVTICHEATMPQTLTSSATVADPNVVATGGFPFTASEGSTSASQTVATFTDPSGAEVLTDYSASINWGDSTPVTAGSLSFSGTVFTVSGSHTYAEEGTYTITVTMNHEATTPQTVTNTASVSDPNVVATGGFSVMAVEGAMPATQTVASFTDAAGAEANDGTHYSASINWGDNTPATTGTISMAGGSTTFTISGSHLYTEEGGYTITVTVNHESGTPQTATSTATISNPSVVASGGFSFSATEGTLSATQTVATFTDPAGAEALSDYSASISWGDGSSAITGAISQNGTTFTVSGSHTYLEEGSDTITVTINHEGTTPQTVTNSATVSNPNVVATGGFAFSASEGSASSSQTVATFVDPGGTGEPSDYSASITWGDGSAATAGSISLTGTTFTVSGSHTYGEEGSATITVTVNHENTAPQTVTSTATIADPGVVSTALAVNATAGTPFFTQALATFTDPGGAEPNPADPSGTITNHYQIVSINWGDSSPLDTTSGSLSYSGSAGSKSAAFTVSGSHTYVAAGSYSITVMINHEGVLSAVTDTAAVSNFGPFFQGNVQTKTSSFWASIVGQELLRRFGLTAGNQTLGQWLASTFPKLYGGVGGAVNLGSFTNSQIAIYYLGLFNHFNSNQLDAAVLSAALYEFATTLSLGGPIAGTAPYSLTVNAIGLGGYLFNIGFNGAAFGVPNLTVLDIFQVLEAANTFAVGGEPWGTNTMLRNEGLSVFRVINGDG